MSERGPRKVPAADSAEAAALDAERSIPPDVERVHDRASAVGSGSALPPEVARAYGPWLGGDLSGVRLHTGPDAERGAHGLAAEAFTTGRDVVVGSGTEGRGTHGLPSSRLLAHELAHVVQGVPSGQVRRKPLAETPVTEIMADPQYVDNAVTRIEFYSAEMARLFFADGRSYDLGLVPEWMKAPVDGVDYRTLRSAHLQLSPPGGDVGSVRFLPNAVGIRAPDGMTTQQVIAVAARTVQFATEPQTGVVMPTEINTISAPRLCTALRAAEAEYVKNTDAIAKGMVKALKVLEIALLLYPGSWGARGAASGGEAAAGRAAAGGAAAADAAAVGVLRSLFLRVLRSGAAETVTVEGVTFSTVEASMRGTELVVTRFSIENVGRVAGQGRFMHGLFERAAIEAAKEAGATAARVSLKTIVNLKNWLPYLESQGYRLEIVNTATGFTKTWSRVFPL